MAAGTLSRIVQTSVRLRRSQSSVVVDAASRQPADGVVAEAKPQEEKPQQDSVVSGFYVRRLIWSIARVALRGRGRRTLRKIADAVLVGVRKVIFRKRIVGVLWTLCYEGNIRRRMSLASRMACEQVDSGRLDVRPAGPIAALCRRMLDEIEVWQHERAGLLNVEILRQSVHSFLTPLVMLEEKASETAAELMRELEVAKEVMEREDFDGSTSAWASEAVMKAWRHLRDCRATSRNLSDKLVAYSSGTSCYEDEAVPREVLASIPAEWLSPLMDELRENGIDDPDTNDNCRVSLASFGAPAEELPIYLRHLCREAWQPHVAKLMAKILQPIEELFQRLSGFAAEVSRTWIVAERTTEARSRQGSKESVAGADVDEAGGCSPIEEMFARKPSKLAESYRSSKGSSSPASPGAKSIDSPARRTASLGRSGRQPAGFLLDEGSRSPVGRRRRMSMSNHDLSPKSPTTSPRAAARARRASQPTLPSMFARANVTEWMLRSAMREACGSPSPTSSRRNTAEQLQMPQRSVGSKASVEDGDLLMSICEEPQRQGSEAIFRSLGLSVEWVYGLPSASAAADNMWVPEQGAAATSLEFVWAPRVAEEGCPGGGCLRALVAAPPLPQRWAATVGLAAGDEIEAVDGCAVNVMALEELADALFARPSRLRVVRRAASPEAIEEAFDEQAPEEGTLGGDDASEAGGFESARSASSSSSSELLYSPQDGHALKWRQVRAQRQLAAGRATAWLGQVSALLGGLRSGARGQRKPRRDGLASSVGSCSRSAVPRAPLESAGTTRRPLFLVANGHLWPRRGGRTPFASPAISVCASAASLPACAGSTAADAFLSGRPTQRARPPEAAYCGGLVGWARPPDATLAPTMLVLPVLSCCGPPSSAMASRPSTVAECRDDAKVSRLVFGGALMSLP